MEKITPSILQAIRQLSVGLKAGLAFVLISVVIIDFSIGIKQAIEGVIEGKITYIGCAIVIGAVTIVCGFKIYFAVKAIKDAASYESK